jgi:predicted dehydrogenase
MTRRKFLQRAGLAAAPLILPGRVLGLDGGVAPSNRIRFGAIGVGNRARSTLPVFLSFPEIEWVAVSDCRADRLRSAKELVDRPYGRSDCRTYPDFQELLAQRDIDAVMIATGNRWHGLASIYAARAGKDIYCEKPISLTLHEGRVLADTCRRFGIMYQAGTQRRATASYQFAREMVRQGRIGKLHTVEMQVWAGSGIPHQAPTAVPEGWDYDRWLGQAPWRPFVPARVNSWQYFWDTAEGMLTDMGAHYTDQMQWTLDTDATGPVHFEAEGQFPDPAKCMSDTPITATARCRYASGVTGVMHQRGSFGQRYIRYIGDEGWIQVDDDTDAVTAAPASILGLRAGGGAGWSNPTDHIRDLLESIRSRRPPSCQAETAHRAQSICQAMNLSLRLGRPLKWDPATERFDNEMANRMRAREPRAPWRI